jgi:hypothetical protein
MDEIVGPRVGRHALAPAVNAVVRSRNLNRLSRNRDTDTPLPFNEFNHCWPLVEGQGPSMHDKRNERTHQSW